jgi:hypothetical protein
MEQTVFWNVDSYLPAYEDGAVCSETLTRIYPPMKMEQTVLWKVDSYLPAYEDGAVCSETLTRIYPPMKMEQTVFWNVDSYLPAYEDGTDSVLKRWHIKSRRRGITQKKAYNIVPLRPQTPRGSEPETSLRCYRFSAARSPISTAKLEMGRAVRFEVSVRLGGTKIPLTDCSVFCVMYLAHYSHSSVALLKGQNRLAEKNKSVCGKFYIPDSGLQSAHTTSV